MSKTDEQFEEFWRQFPRGRKQSKQVARRTFRAIVSGKHRDLKATADELIQGAMRYAAAMGDHHPYVKMPSTWLNGGCWEDEDLAPPEQLPPGDSLRGRSLAQALSDRSWAEQPGGDNRLPERLSTRKRSLYEDLTDRSWAK